MNYSYFAESDTVTNLLDEKTDLQEKLKAREIELSRIQYELNCIINGNPNVNASNISVQQTVGCSAMKFSDLEYLVYNMQIQIPDANGNFTAVQQQKNKENEAVIYQYEWAKKRKEELTGINEVSKKAIERLKEKIKKIDALINKKTIEKSEKEKIEEDKKKEKKLILIGGSILLIIVAYSILKQK